MLATVHDDTAMAEEAVRCARIASNPTMLSYALSVLAILLLAQEPERARTLLQEATQTAGAVGNAEAEALARQVLGGVLSTLGDHLGAARMSLASAEQSFRSGDRFYAFGQLWSVVVALDALGDTEHVSLLGAWLMRRGAVVAGMKPVRIEHLQALTSEDLEALDPLIETMTDDDAVALARDSIEPHATLAGDAGVSPGSPPG